MSANVISSWNYKFQHSGVSESLTYNLLVFQGWTAFGQKMKEWAVIGGKAVLAFILLLDIIPFMFGVLLDLVVLTPVRVPLHQSPI